MQIVPVRALPVALPVFAEEELEESAAEDDNEELDRAAAEPEEEDPTEGADEGVQAAARQFQEALDETLYGLGPQSGEDQLLKVRSGYSLFRRSQAIPCLPPMDST